MGHPWLRPWQGSFAVRHSRAVRTLFVEANGFPLGEHAPPDRGRDPQVLGIFGMPPYVVRRPLSKCGPPAQLFGARCEWE